MVEARASASKCPQGHLRARWRALEPKPATRSAPDAGPVLHGRAYLCTSACFAALHERKYEAMRHVPVGSLMMIWRRSVLSADGRQRGRLQAGRAAASVCPTASRLMNCGGAFSRLDQFHEQGCAVPRASVPASASGRSWAQPGGQGCLRSTSPFISQLRAGLDECVQVLV